jgi:hypothetical protein
LQKLTCQRQGHAQGNGEGRERLHVWMVLLAAWVSNGFGLVAPLLTFTLWSDEIRDQENR